MVPVGWGPEFKDRPTPGLSHESRQYFGIAHSARQPGCGAG